MESSYSESLDEFLGLHSERKEDWDFAGSDTQYLTHGLHAYPARMIPQVASRLVERYSKERQVNLDPFCGSGTVVVESILRNRNAIGNDINPLSRLLTKVKSTPLDPKQLDLHVSKVLAAARKNVEGYRDGNLKFESIAAVNFPNLTLWFKAKIIHELSLIRELIFEIENPDVRDFFKVCFSNTVRRTSNANRDGDTFIKRISERELAKHNPDTFSEFSKTVIENSHLMKSFWNAFTAIPDPKPHSQMLAEDARQMSLNTASVDNIITSPPYGEEKNTISYNRWSKLSLFWLGYSRDEIAAAEKLTLGSKNGNDRTIHSPTVETILSDVEKEDKKLANDAEAFFTDYKTAIRELYRVLKEEGYCCIVLGNRSLKRRRVPMDKVTVDFGKDLGFKQVVTYYRNIPSKSIPWTVAKGDTIASENIIIMRK